MMCARLVRYSADEQPMSAKPLQLRTWVAVRRHETRAPADSLLPAGPPSRTDWGSSATVAPSLPLAGVPRAAWR